MLDKLFSIKEVDLHYIVKFCGIRFKIKNSKKAFAELKKLCQQMKRSQIPTIYNTNLTLEQKIWFLSQRFYEEVGYYPNFKNPHSFNEKINWMKLNYYNPLEQRCIDKYEFKGYIKEILGSDYTIPLIGVYDDVNDIDFDFLPDKFVIKTTASGSAQGVKVVKDKKKLDIDKLKYEFNSLLQEWNTIYYHCLSRGYKEIKPRIIIEEFVKELAEKDCDYKFFCFHGKVKCFYLANNFAKSKQHRLSYFDLNGEKLPFIYDNYAPINIKRYQKSKNFDRMIEIAEKLSAPFPFVRVDFYDLKDKLYIGEMTFTPGGGFGKYTPVEWDYKLGEWLDLNKIQEEYIHIFPQLKVTNKGG